MLTQENVDITVTLWQFNVAMKNGPVEIVDFPINSMLIFHNYVSLPEGIYNYMYIYKSTIKHY